MRLVPRMSRRGKISLVVIILLAAIASALLVADREDDEPRYQGRRLSEWVRLTYSVDETSAEGRALFAQRRAVCDAIGTNAFAHMVKWIQLEPSWFKRRFGLWASRLPSFIGESRPARWLFESKNETRKWAGLALFGHFGTNAAPAAP